MTEGRKFNILLWKENTFIRPQRYKRKLLTLEEANERLHRYFPNMDILVYRSSAKPALLYCKDCAKTYETKSSISVYMYSYRVRCESCAEIERVQRVKDFLGECGLIYKGFSIIKKDKIYRIIKYSCSYCGYEDTAYEYSLDSSNYSGCKKCKYNKTTDKYTETLRENNCTYLSRYATKGINRATIITYKYNSCGHKHTVRSNALSENKIPECPICKRRERLEFIKDEGMRLSELGFHLVKYRSSIDVSCIHLFCGDSKEHTNIYNKNLLCGKCRGSLLLGKPKEHKKHLVEEKLAMLKSVQSFKNAWLSQVPDALEKLDEGFVKVILTHIDGWIKNYEEIAKTYPNGDLGTVIENNPLYKQVEDTFYPIMEKYGFKI